MRFPRAGYFDGNVLRVANSRVTNVDPLFPASISILRPNSEWLLRHIARRMCVQLCCISVNRRAVGVPPAEAAIDGDSVARS